jgi:hypothetical protein
MRFDLPPRSQPGGWPNTGVELQKDDNFNQPALSQAYYGSNQNRQNWRHILQQPIL